MTSRLNIPSWSWAANCEGGIHQPDVPGLPWETLLHVRDVQVKLDGGDPFGNVSSGILTISTRLLVPCMIEETHNGEGYNSKFITAIIKTGSISSRCDISWDIITKTAGQNFFLLMVYRGPYGMTGLILRHNGVINGEYTRVGIFDSHNDSLVVFGQGLEKLEKMSEKLVCEGDCCSAKHDENGRKWYTITIL